MTACIHENVMGPRELFAFRAKQMNVTYQKHVGFDYDNRFSTNKQNLILNK